ncbi:hypothetical protein SHIRM173S_08910 [Streptomyces hirsutus]
MSGTPAKKDVKLPKTFPGAEQEGERLQKVLARAGYGSRRACEELIEQARVEVTARSSWSRASGSTRRRTRSRSTA